MSPIPMLLPVLGYAAVLESDHAGAAFRSFVLKITVGPPGSAEFGQTLPHVQQKVADAPPRICADLVRISGLWRKKSRKTSSIPRESLQPDSAGDGFFASILCPFPASSQHRSNPLPPFLLLQNPDAAPISPSAHCWLRSGLRFSVAGRWGEQHRHGPRTHRQSSPMIRRAI